MQNNSKHWEASLEANKIPGFGKQLTASANANINKNDHNVNAHVFATKNFREGLVPNYSSHGAGINYSYKDKVGVGASTANTPKFKTREHNVSGNVNLHKTPTSSLDLNAGASRTTNPSGRGHWQSNGSLNFRKQF